MPIKASKFFNEIDQSQLAADAGIKLRPSVLLIFGNPPLGTQFITANANAGLDWPVRLLVYENEKGEVWTAYTDFDWIARRHGIQEPQRPVQDGVKRYHLDHFERESKVAVELAKSASAGPPEPLARGRVRRWRHRHERGDRLQSIQLLTDYTIQVVGSGIEIFGILIIVTGIASSTYLHLRRPMPGENTEVYKIRIGRSLLLGLQVLVAADIVKTIAHELSFISLGLLAGLVLVRTFLSWTLVLEIDGRWPWQREPSPMSVESAD